MKRLMKLEIFLLALVLLGAGFFALRLGTSGPQVQTNAALPPETTAPSQPPETTPVPTKAPPQWMTFPADRALKAQQYFVYDCDTDTFLKQSSQNGEKVYPASITKLFTAYVAMQYLDPDQKITAGDALDLVAWGSSVAEIAKGDTLSTDLLVEAMLLPSGNDAACLLAAEVGRIIGDNPNMSAKDAVDGFMKEMNSKAAALGMTGTHFVTPDGIHDDNHYTNFQDLAILGKMALQDSTIMKNAGTAHHMVTLESGQKEWENTNALVDQKTPYYCPYAVGLKTGQTPSAGSCLLSAFQMEGRTLLIGVFGCPEEEDRFEDTLQLFNEAMGI